MKIKRLILPPLDNNVYIISNNSKAIIVDPSSNERIIEEYLKENKLELKCIFITHYHFDHIGALEYFKNKYDIKIYDYSTIGKFKEIDLKFEIIPTKGHSKDCVSFYFNESQDMFVGDFIFNGSIGRTDLETGDDDEMYYSLRKLKEYPLEIKLYPGHGNTTTLLDETKYNPYL